MIVAPFHDNDVISSFSDHVTHIVLITPLMLDEDLLAGSFRPMHTNEQNISSCNIKII